MTQGTCHYVQPVPATSNMRHAQLFVLAARRITHNTLAAAPHRQRPNAARCCTLCYECELFVLVYTCCYSLQPREHSGPCLPKGFCCWAELQFEFWPRSADVKMHNIAAQSSAAVRYLRALTSINSSPSPKKDKGAPLHLIIVFGSCQVSMLLGLLSTSFSMPKLL